MDGLPAMREGWREFLLQWDDLRVEADEYRELDAERVLVLDHSRGLGKSSGNRRSVNGARLSFMFAKAKLQGSSTTGIAALLSPTSAWRTDESQGSGRNSSFVRESFLVRVTTS